jgi:hypothetical protein
VLSPASNPYFVFAYRRCTIARMSESQDPGAAAGNTRAYTIDSDFPGGNIRVERMEGNSIYLHQELRDTEIWWFYWHFRVRGAAGRELTFHFTQGNVIGSQGPAVSVDGGRSWAWLGAQAVQDTAFVYAFPMGQDEVRFCFAPAYVESDLHRFLAQWQGHPALHTGSLCQTRKGRTVEYVRLGATDQCVRHRVLLTCRHHACESIASYALEGMMAAVLESSYDSEPVWDTVEFMIVPFMDKDGVEEGDQGKQRHPRDHWLDYEGISLYRTTGALREKGPAWSDGKLRVALDLHCPHIRGTTNEAIYCVGGFDSQNWEEIQRFSAILETTRSGPLPYRTTDNIPFGVAWNTAENLSQGMSFAEWAIALPTTRMATTIEIPYATVHDHPMTVEAARTLGQDLARALYHYLAVIV